MSEDKTMKELEQLLEFISEEERQELMDELKQLKMDKTPEEILTKHINYLVERDKLKSFDVLKQMPEWDRVIAAIEEYGKQQYNQAIKDAAEKCVGIGFITTIKQSILKLLKP